MAPEHSIQCDTANNQCNGGYISRAFQFHVNSGLVPQSCKAYRGTSARRCSDECDDSTLIEPSIVYNMLTYRRIHASTQNETAEMIKEAIYANGSVAASFKVYEDFQEYYGFFNKKDVYKDPGEGYRGEFYTYHAIKIIGYDFTANTPYWIIQNSWGTSWADGGYFRLDATLNDGNTERLEGVLDILGDVYQPFVEPYKDECAPFYNCEECNTHGPKSANTQSTHTAGTNGASDSTLIPQKRFTWPKLFSRHSGHGKRPSVWRSFQSQGMPRPRANNSESEPVCGYCLTSDMCVSVDSSGRPLRGLCEEMAKSASVATSKLSNSDITYRLCPVDDCVSYSENPLQCLRHKGCHFCSQTNKCKKGSRGQQNSGECLSPITSYAQLVQNYSCILLDEARCLKNSACGWCDKTSSCLPVKTAYKDCQPALGHCYNDDNEEDCKRGGSSSAHLTNTQTTQRSNVQTSDAADEAFCLHQPCSLCGATKNSRCKWCYTTETCVPETDTSCSISSNNVESKLGNKTFGHADYPTQTLTRCSHCLNYSSCQDCAGDPQCGWYSDMALCMPGILDSSLTTVLPDDYQKDTFITNRLRCPVIYLDDANDADASGQAKTKSDTGSSQDSPV